MHCVGSHLCFWIWTILRETVDSMNHHHHEPPASLHHHMKTGNGSDLYQAKQEQIDFNKNKIKIKLVNQVIQV